MINLLKQFEAGLLLLEEEEEGEDTWIKKTHYQ